MTGCVDNVDAMSSLLPRILCPASDRPSCDISIVKERPCQGSLQPFFPLKLEIHCSHCRHAVINTASSTKLTDMESTSLDCSSLLVILQDIKDTAQPDELTDFHHLKARQGMSQLELEDEVQTDLQHNQGLHKKPNVPHLHSPQLPLAAHWLSSSMRAFEWVRAQQG